MTCMRARCQADLTCRCEPISRSYAESAYSSNWERSSGVYHLGCCAHGRKAARRRLQAPMILTHQVRLPLRVGAHAVTSALTKPRDCTTSAIEQDMARKRYDVEFSVIWDEPRRAFSIEQAGVSTGRFFAVRGKAIEVATDAARFESREG